MEVKTEGLPVLRARAGLVGGVVLTCALTVLGTAPAASAAVNVTVTVTAGDVGIAGAAYTGTTAPTGEKPESKLWFAAGAWWGSLQTATGGFGIFRLDRASGAWQDTGTPLDPRPTSRADVVVAGDRLYVASHEMSASSTTTDEAPALLYRFTHDPNTDTYVPDGDEPSTITATSSETLTIDRDRQGLLWATWMLDRRPRVSASSDDGETWEESVTLDDPAGPMATADDISTLVAFGTSVGVLWSNQATDAFLFAEHVDGEPLDAWQPTVVVAQGPDLADDHLNLKADTTGRVFAAVKTSLDLTGDPAAAQILLLDRDPASAAWRRTTFSTVADCHTRPVVVVDQQAQRLHLLATGSSSGCPFSGSSGTIFEKTSPIAGPIFGKGRGTPVIHDAASETLNNVTAAKQPLSVATGLVVLASNDTTGRYWHSDRALGAPRAAFRPSVVRGRAPLAVTFTSSSRGAPTGYLWRFGDGNTSTAERPTHTYTAPGIYTVSLSVTNAAGTSTLVKRRLIRVTG